MKWATLPCHVCTADARIPAAIARHLSAEGVRCGQHQKSPEPVEQPLSERDNWMRTVVPPDFRGATLGEVETASLRRLLNAVVESYPDRCRNLAGQPVKVIPIGGPVGVGKSSAAWATVIALVQSGKLSPRQVVCGSEATLLEPNAHITAYGRPGQPSVWRTLIPTGTKVLLLDDLGYARYADRNARMGLVKGLLDRVSERDVLTLITTNLSTPADMEATIGSAAWSRMVALSGLPARDGLLVAGTVDRRTGIDRTT